MYIYIYIYIYTYIYVYIYDSILKYNTILIFCINCTCSHFFWNVDSLSGNTEVHFQLTKSFLFLDKKTVALFYVYLTNKEERNHWNKDWSEQLKDYQGAQRREWSSRNYHVWTFTVILLWDVCHLSYRYCSNGSKHWICRNIKCTVSSGLCLDCQRREMSYWEWPHNILN
jgi:hypothetical protein